MGTGDVEISVVAAEEGLVVNAFEVHALLQLVRLAGGPAASPPTRERLEKALPAHSLPRRSEGKKREEKTLGFVDPQGSLE